MLDKEKGPEGGPLSYSYYTAPCRALLTPNRATSCNAYLGMGASLFKLGKAELLQLRPIGED